MKNKISVILNIILTITVIFIFTYIATDKNINKEKENNNSIDTKIAADRIENYVKSIFGFNFEDNFGDISIDIEEGKYTVNIAFVPSVGSFPVKSEIYEYVGFRSYQIISFFSEVRRFNYTVLWDDKDKKEAMKLIIDEGAVKELYSNYWEAVRSKNEGYENTYKNIFSSIIETEESKAWREVIDRNANLP